MAGVLYALPSTRTRPSIQTQSLQAAIAAVKALEVSLEQLHAEWESTPSDNIEQEVRQRTRLAYAVYEMHRLAIALSQK